MPCYANSAFAVLGEVGGNSGDGTAHLRCGPLIERGQAHECLLVSMNMIDVLQRDLGFDDQGITPGTISMIGSSCVTTLPTVWMAS